MSKIVNYANDKKAVEKAMEFIDIYKQVIDERSVIEDRWEQFWNMWKVYTDIKYYEGTSQIYLPIMRKATEEGVNNIATKLFPTDDFINVRAMSGTPEKYADGVRALLVFQMVEEMQLPLHIKTSLREMLINGTCVAKIGFNGKKFAPFFKPLSLKDDFYLYPSTVNDIDEAMVTFERIRIDRYELEYLAEKGKYMSIEQLNEEGSEESLRERRTEIINKPVENNPKLPIYDLVETYCVMKLGNEYKDVIITFDPTARKIIQITPSPYKYTSPSKEDVYFKPYVAHSLIRLPKNFYSPSIYEVGQRLQYALNDMTNLTLDNGILQQTPIVKADRARIGNMASLVFKPRAVWDCEPDAVVFDRPPDVLGSGAALVGQLKFWLEENANIGGLTPMTSKRTTATEIATYNQLMGTFISSTVADIEAGFTLPAAKKVFYLDQIYLENKDIKRILGLQAKYVQLGKEGKKIIQRDYMFRWLGSTQSMNIHIKSQQAINFIGMAASIPPQALGGNQINYSYLLKEAWRNLGNSDVDKVVIEKNLPEIDPREENEMLLNGKEVNTHINDDDMTHILTHNLAGDQTKDEAIFTNITLHIQEHIEQARQKLQVQQMIQQQNMIGQMEQSGAGETSGAPIDKPSVQRRTPITQANTFGEVAASTVGGGAPKPPIVSPIEELR